MTLVYAFMVIAIRRVRKNMDYGAELKAQIEAEILRK